MLESHAEQSDQLDVHLESSPTSQCGGGGGIGGAGGGFGHSGAKHEYRFVCP